jgi:two-component system CheB/CheR fusion protein
MKGNKPQSATQGSKERPGGAALPGRPLVPSESAGPAAIVGVGASAGGIEAFTALLKELPATTGLAFVFVQHPAPAHTRMLAEILQRATSMRVIEVHDEPCVEPNCVYVIPPARAMVLRDRHLSLTPRNKGRHHPVDVLFESLAANQAQRSIGIVLSGTVSDGTAGLAAIKAAGGITIAQDRTALHGGMPRNAIAAGCVDFVLPPAGIARELVRIATHPYVEELEASREEVHSSNAELATVNEQLQDRNGELSRLNSDLSNLFGSLQMGIVMVWQDLRIRRFTPAAEKLFNLINTDIGRPIGDIKLNINVADLPRVLAEVIDSMTTRELEVQDKHGRWYLMRVRPYRTPDNTIDGAIILLFDIDAVKLSRDVLKRQARLLEQAHEAVLVREMTGEIVYWNRGAELLYGFSANEAQGKLTHELLGKTSAVQTALNQALIHEGRWSGELAHRTKDGRELAVESSQVLVDEGGQRRVLATNRDITDRRRLEDTLRRRVEELAVADRHKSEFLAMLAHELRNPLASLRYAVEVIKAVPLGDPRNGRATELVDRQVSMLARLVDDLLDVARINRGQIQLRKETAELQTILTRAIETTRGLMDARRLALSVLVPHAPLVLEADATRLEQVFANLLNNAAKYTPEGGEISVQVELMPPGRAAAVVEIAVRVRDTGVGIAPEMLRRVFDLFTQADRSLAHSQGGLGIGLSLVRSLVEMHGGRVTAHSDGPGRGSEFVVYLPLSSHSTTGEDRHPADTCADPSKRNITGE